MGGFNASPVAHIKSCRNVWRGVAVQHARKLSLLSITNSSIASRSFATLVSYPLISVSTHGGDNHQYYNSIGIAIHDHVDPGTAGSWTPLVMAGILLNLNCSILGPKVGRPFRVNISRDESIDALKDAIKEKKKPRLDHIPADELDIWMAGDLMHNVPAMADNLWCDTFTAPGTPFKGRNSARNSARSLKMGYPRGRSLTLWKRWHIIFLQTQTPGCFTSSCELLVSHVISILINYRQLALFIPISSPIFRLTLALCQVPRFHPRAVLD